MIDGKELDIDIWACRQQALTLSDKEVLSLERALVEDPNDIEVRVKLLCFYGERQFSNKVIDDYEQKRIAHVVWFIENTPESEILWFPDSHVDKILSPDEWLSVSNVWSSVTSKKDVSTHALSNAARFFLQSDWTVCERLLSEAINREPKNLDWVKQLALVYDFWADRVDGLNLKALECWKTCFRKERKATRKFKHLRRLARAAFEANDLALAEKSAQDVLAAASIEKHSWDFGNAIHHGNIVLGLVALRKNRIPEACNHLLLAGKTCGSPQLNSFGPDFVLAERLLAAGESSCVKEYLTSCRTFWSGHEHIIDEWISLVERGGKPRFNKH